MCHHMLFRSVYSFISLRSVLHVNIYFDLCPTMRMHNFSAPNVSAEKVFLGGGEHGASSQLTRNVERSLKPI